VLKLIQLEQDFEWCETPSHWYGWNLDKCGLVAMHIDPYDTTSSNFKTINECKMGI